jgi:hypothetical protein
MVVAVKDIRNDDCANPPALRDDGVRGYFNFSHLTSVTANRLPNRRCESQCFFWNSAKRLDDGLTLSRF